MRDVSNTNNVKTWVIDWFEYRYSLTRECIETAKTLSGVACFDDVDKYFLEFDAETDFGITVPEGSFDGCDTLDSIVSKLTEIIEKDA